ncbi:hypothetical protein EV702DRAFT_1205659 [Suillus placidus]|uniref:Uncharacterized protein n=1 Tax=Suillus placidus TaxID=48579 RepID=A0A9P6ZG47_9AGAM|nr:hypothetical protein EV702DRAFT_1205659 [Suillus placidus]
MSPTTPSSPQLDADPTPQYLIVKKAKGVMKEAKQNTEIAEKVFLEAVAHIAPAVSLTASQIPDHKESCKKLSTITTTVHWVFKKEA